MIGFVPVCVPTANNESSAAAAATAAAAAARDDTGDGAERAAGVGGVEDHVRKVRR